MAQRVAAILLATGLMMVLAAGMLVRRDPTKPTMLVLPNMVVSPAYGAHSPNPCFADGKTLREPPAGSIARGQLPLHYSASAEDAARAGEELHNPFDVNDASALQRGQAVYASFCVMCHGSDGTGNGPVVQRGFPPPPSLLAERARRLRDGQVFHILTYGQNNMPAHAAQISREDRWKVILFVRTLQKQDGGSDAPMVPPATQEAAVDEVAREVAG